MQMAYDDVGMTSEDQIEDGSEHYDEITDDKSPLSREDDETIENEFHEEETDEVLPGIPGEDDSALPHATKNESAIETNEPVSYENGSHSHRDDTVQQEDHDDDNLRAPGTDESMDDTHFVMDTVQNKGTPKTSVGKDQHSSLQKHDVVNKLTTDSQATKHHSENSAKKANDKETESSSVKPSPTSNQVAPSTKESDKNSSEPKSSQRGRGRGRGKGVRGGRGGRGGRGKKRGGK